MAQARTDFSLALAQISAERGIEPNVIIDSINLAMLAALKREYNISEEDIEEYESKIDENSGEVTIFKKGEDVTPADFGRIAAQVAKQVIMQRVREAEKDAIIDEYEGKLQTLITGMVLRFDGPNVVIDIGRGQGIMPPQEQIPNEFYRLNQRIAVFIEDIRETFKGKAIIVSRSNPQLVIELFKREVPEVSSGAVEVVAIAREAGHRTKLAVKSTQDGVDPVGSCVGQKGIRVQAVINELNGEKIDIIEFSENPAEYIKASLAPAEGLEIKIDEAKQKAIITVPDDQLSLAIGKGGQNARLAAKLTGYHIDIKGEGAKSAALSTGGDETFEIDELGLSTRIRNTILEAGISKIKELEEKLPEITDLLLEADERSIDEIKKSIERREKRLKQLKEEAEKLEKLKESQEEASRENEA